MNDTQVVHGWQWPQWSIKKSIKSDHNASFRVVLSITLVDNGSNMDENE